MNRDLKLALRLQEILPEASDADVDSFIEVSSWKPLLVVAMALYRYPVGTPCFPIWYRCNLRTEARPVNRRQCRVEEGRNNLPDVQRSGPGWPGCSFRCRVRQNGTRSSLGSAARMTDLPTRRQICAYAIVIW